jgi:TolB-like protein/Tfp pilus assembly protein PilF
MAKGLAAAHEKGVVHRDLKPDNVFVGRDGHVKILDFGLAKRQEKVAPGEETSAPTASGHTEPGTVMGTVGYMSPEQVRGLPLDHRTDIFSFGAILYEMLSGRRAFKKDTSADTMAAIMLQEPPELTASGRSISPALDHIVKHCLEKERDQRFQSAQDVAFNLSEASDAKPVTSGAQAIAPAPRGTSRVWIVAVAIVVLAVAGLLLWKRPKSGPAASSSVKRVAVLPFENLGAPEDDYFADGMSDEVRSKLTSLPGIEVIARPSSTTYKKTTKKPREIAEELGVGYLLTATVRWQKSVGASRVHVTPELVEIGQSGAPASKWEEPFDAAVTDVFQVQSDIATKVAEALGIAFAEGSRKQLGEKPTQNLAAYDAFLKGESASSRREALGFYEQAVALDPTFAEAWAAVSVMNSSMYVMLHSAERAKRAFEAGEKAVELAPNRPDGYIALGKNYDNVVGDYRRAIDEFEKARKLAPASGEPLGAIGFAESHLGHWEEAIQFYREAVRRDPQSATAHDRLASALVFVRRHREAREEADRGLALDPSNIHLFQLKVVTYLGEGDLVAARTVMKAVPKEIEPIGLVSFFAWYRDLGWVLDDAQRGLLLRLTPSAFDDKGTWGLCLAQAYALQGDSSNLRRYAEEARGGFEEQLRSAPDDLQARALLGVALAYLGRKEEAVREGQRTVAQGPVAKDAVLGPYVEHQLARVYVLVGEPEKAIDELEALLRIPYWVSPGWLKIDPNFDPLRKNPRFQKLVAGK